MFESGATCLTLLVVLQLTSRRIRFTTCLWSKRLVVEKKCLYIVHVSLACFQNRLYLNNHDIQLVCHKKSKNGAKMNKIVQKCQFWMTFYSTMKMEVGISLNGPNKWFPPYWFLIAQHMKYPKIIMRAPVHFFWVVTTLGLQCDLCLIDFCKNYSLKRPLIAKTKVRHKS